MSGSAIEHPEFRFSWPGEGGPNVDYISSPPPPDYCSRRPRRLALLGSTGSVGRAAFNIALADPDFFRIEALAGGKNTKLLAEQGALCSARFLATRDETTALELRSRLKEGYRPEILYGKSGYEKIASLDSVDCVLSAQSGAVGLYGTLAAARAGKVIALANKESLAIGGNLIREACRRNGASVLPVDSEHFALFQCASGRGQTPSKFILTASGGPFRGLEREETRKKTVKEALRHPKWKMGAKITIDSATLMNKGLEFIEAMSLFGVPSERVEIVVHPQSIVHSLVQFRDNSLLAQLAVPDMRLPIADCLRWPEIAENCVKPLDLLEAGTLAFEAPDYEAFPCPLLAREAVACEARIGENRDLNPALAILNAANEAAVELFIGGKCLFGDIPELVRLTLDSCLSRLNDLRASLDSADSEEIIFKLDAIARERAREFGARTRI